MPIIALGKQTITYCLKRSAKARRLRLEYGLAGLHIVAPYQLSNRDIIQFLFQQKQWLLKQTNKRQQQLQEQAKWLDAQADRVPQMQWDRQQTFRLNVSNSVEKYSQLLGKKPSGVYLKTQRRRWGSCGIHNQIYINWKLMFVPLVVLDYVILHECCHLFHRNHGRHFWTLVQTYMPDYKVQEKWLRQHSEIIYQQQQEFIECQAVLTSS